MAITRTRFVVLTCAALLALVAMGRADVVINEFVHHEGAQWIELKNTGDQPVDLEGWQLQTLVTTFHTFPEGTELAAAAYLVFEPEDDVWEPTGDHLTLRNGDGTAVDYVCYGDVTPEPPDETSWTGAPIPPAPNGASLALIPDGEDLDRATNWLPRAAGFITKGSANAPQPPPRVEVSIAYPDDKDYVSECEEITLTLTVKNEDPAASVFDVEAMLELPLGFTYMASNPDGNYDTNAHTTAWDVGAIEADDAWEAQVRLRPVCGAEPEQIAQARVDWAYYPEADPQPEIEEESDPIVVEPVRLALRKLAYNKSEGETDDDADTVVQAQLGDTVVFIIELQNTSDGDVVDAGAAIEDVLEDGLLFLTLTDDGAEQVLHTGDGTADDPYRWNSGPIPAGATVRFFLEAEVMGCAQLTNEAAFNWGCPGEASCRTGQASASVALILLSPDVDFEVGPSPVVIDYCEGGEVAITLRSGDPDEPDSEVGPARNVKINCVGFPAAFEVSEITGGVTYADGVFTIGDLEPNTEFSFTFQLGIREGHCAPPMSGTFAAYLTYDDDCGVPYGPPVCLEDFVVVNRPVISVSKSGPQSVDVGQEGIEFELSVRYEGQVPQEIVITDVYPSDAGLFTVVDAVGGVDDPVEGTIVWSHTFETSGEIWERTVVMDAPTDPCAGGNAYTNTLSIDPDTFQDCLDCPVTVSSATHTVYVNHSEIAAIVDHEKTVVYENLNTNDVTTPGQNAAETCTNIQYTTCVTFNEGDAAPGSWSDITFTESMAQGQLFVSLDEVRINGDDYNLDCVAITGTEGTFTLDLSGLDGCAAPPPNVGTENAGAQLCLVYTLQAPEDPGTFWDWSYFTLPETFEVGCNASRYYYQGVMVTVARSGVSVGVSGPPVVDKCGVDTYTVVVNKGVFQAYDVLVELHMQVQGNYAYLAGSTVFSGFTDADGETIDSFEPSLEDGVLSWDLGDLDSGGTISVDLRKRCAPEATDYTAWVWYNDNCENQPDDNIVDRAFSASASGSASLLTAGNLSVSIQPETYYAVSGYPVFTVYITNSGNGAVYGATVTLDFEGIVVYHDTHSSSGVEPSSFAGAPGDSQVTWTFDVIPAGRRSVFTVVGSLEDCGSAAIRVEGVWGCEEQTTDCQADLPVTDVMTIELQGVDLGVTQHTVSPPVIDYCGDPVTFIVQARNFGPGMAYHPWLETVLAPGLVYVSNSAEYSLDGGASWEPFPNGYTSYEDRTLRWSFADLLTTSDSQGTPVVRSGRRFAVRFQARLPDCAAAAAFEAGGKRNDARALYNLPCNHTKVPDDPLEESDVRALSLTGARPRVSVQVLARNETQGLPLTGGTLSALPDDTVVFRVTLTSDGDHRAQQVYLENVLPSNVTYVDWEVVGTESDVDFTKRDSVLVWDVDRDDGDLEVGETAVLEITGTVDDCASVTTNTATVHWGCCPEDRDSDSDTVNVKTRLDPGDLRLEVAAEDFSTCGGEITVTVENRDGFHTAHGFVLEVTLPGHENTAPWVYDPAAGGTTIGSTDTDRTFEVGEEEPQSTQGTRLTWEETGNLVEGNAYVGPLEVLTFTFRVKASGAYCVGPDEPEVQHIPVDSIVATFDYRDVCGNELDQHQLDASTDVDPVQPDVVIRSVIADPPLASTGDRITWMIILENQGDGTAQNVGLRSVFGSGYDAESVEDIAPEEGSLDSAEREVTWEGLELAPGETKAFSYSVEIKEPGTLTNVATVEGWCQDADGENLCRHSYDEKTGEAAGVDLRKTITAIGAPGVIDPEDERAGTATIGNVVTYTIEVAYIGEGVYEGVTITDELPAGLAFEIKTYSTDPVVDVVFSEDAGRLVWTLGSGDPPTFQDSLEVTLTVEARVRDVDTNTWNPHTELANSVHTDFTLNGISYEHTDERYADAITDETTITVIEPWIADDDDYAKTADPACGEFVQANDPITYTFTARNTGTSPAYDLVFIDVLPVGMRVAEPEITSVSIEDTDTSTRELGEDSDFTVDWQDEDGTLTITLLDTQSAHLAPGELLKLVYVATVDEGVGAGAVLENAARVASYASLPGDPATQRIYGHTVGENAYGYLPVVVCAHETASLPDNTKSVASTVTAPTVPSHTANEATIGETIIYVVAIVVPTGTTAYDLVFEDEVADGLAVESAAYDVEDGDTGTAVLDLNGTTEVSASIGDVAALPAVDYPEGRTVTVTIEARVRGQFDDDSPVVRGHVFENFATYTWNRVAGEEETSISVDSNTVTTTVIEPELALAKANNAVDGVVERGQTVRFTVTLTNTDEHAPAYDAALTDVLPAELRPAELQPISVHLNGDALDEADYEFAYDEAEGTISLQVTGLAHSIEPEGSLELVYEVAVPEDIGAGRAGARALVNEAFGQAYSLPGEEDHPDRRRLYEVGPKRAPLTTPYPVLGKDQDPVDGDTISPDDIILYTLSFPEPAIEVTLYDVVVTDEVPDGLSVTSVTLVGGTGGSYSIEGRLVTVTFATIEPGEQATVMIDCTVNTVFDSGSAIPLGYTFTNRAQLAWYDADTADGERRSQVVLSDIVRAHFEGPAVVLSPNHTRETMPATMVTYRHRLANLGTETVTVQLTYGPSTKAWEWILYDGDGDGGITGGPLFSNAPLTLEPDEERELIMRAFVPSDATAGTVDAVTLTAEWNGYQAHATNITTVRTGKVELRKEVSTDGGATWGTREAATPGQAVAFRLTFTNIGAIELHNVEVIDAVPDHMVYEAGSADVDELADYSVTYSDDGGVTWSTGEPSPDTVTHLRWELAGILSAGDSRYVTYEAVVR